jgi:hypothetical protein
MYFTPSKRIISELNSVICLTIFALSSLTYGGNPVPLAKRAAMLAQKAGAEFANLAEGIAVENVAVTGAKQAGSLLLRTSIGAAVAGASEVMVGGVLGLTGGTAATLTLALGSAPAFMSLGNTQAQEVKNYYFRLWGPIGYLKQLPTKAEVYELKNILNEASDLAGQKYGEYVKRNKLNWCGKSMPDCQLNFKNVFISTMPFSRAVVVANSTTWEISADAIFLTPKINHEKMVVAAAVELLRVAADYDYDGMKNKIDNDLMIRENYMLDVLKSRHRCVRDQAKTLMANLILGQTLDEDFYNHCQEPLPDKFYNKDSQSSSEAESTFSFLQDVKSTSDSLEHREFEIPQGNYKIIKSGSSDDKSVAQGCTVESVHKKLSDETLLALFNDAKREAKNTFTTFVKYKNLNWCSSFNDNVCSPKYELMSLSDSPNVIQSYESASSGKHLVWSIPFKTLCGYREVLRKDYVHYLAFELLRKTPSSEHLKKVYDTAQSLRYSDRFRGKLMCDEAANTMLAFYMYGKPINIDYLNSLCQGRPLPPPSSYYDKVYRNSDSVRVQTIASANFRDSLPLFTSCGPNELQDLFLAELPKCQSWDLTPLRRALGIYSYDVSKLSDRDSNLKAVEGGARLIERAFWPTLALIVAHKNAKTKLAARFVAGITSQIFSRYFGLLKAEKAYKVGNFAMRAVFDGSAVYAANKVADTVSFYFDIDKIFPPDLMSKAFDGDVDAKKKFRANLDNILGNEQEPHVFTDATFENFFYYLAQNSPEGYKYIKLVEQQSRRH